MTSSITGVIKSVSGDGKRFKLDNEEWYGVYSASMLKAKPGDTVGFDYASVEKAGRIFHNVKGNISILSASAAPAGGSTPPPAYSRPDAILPVHMSKDRCIIRQNSLTNAVAFCARNAIEVGTVSVEDVIAIAREFEAYSTGDADIAEAKALAGSSLTSSATES